MTMLLRSGKEVKLCSESPNTAISVQGCYECKVKFSSVVPRCWLVETRDIITEEVKLYASQKSLWPAKNDPTVWVSTAWCGFNAPTWTEEARGLPYCQHCALAKPLEIYDTGRKVNSIWDLAFDAITQ